MCSYKQYFLEFHSIPSNYHLLNAKVLSSNSTMYREIGACQIGDEDFNGCQEYEVDYVENLEGSKWSYLNT